SPGFFKTLGISLVSGRDFDWSDDPKHPRVAILDNNLSKGLFRGEDRINGTRVHFGVQPELQDLEVIGVAKSATILDIRSRELPVIYVPGIQHAALDPAGQLFIRGTGTQLSARAIENRIRALGREYVASIRSVHDVTERSLVRERAVALLASFFGALALILAGFGLFGLISYSVTGRTREIGVRVALGSQRSGVIWLVLRETLLLTFTGVLAGIPCALAVGSLLKHQLFGITYGDPVTLIVVPTVLIGVAVLASYLPARRAVQVDPTVALRWE
ncbi:MAG: FtsX-like permease family protein, partial [Acidobacteriaceae bacterium]|nr:FtsX-like permease family protein [Acidobacteriaceae bacterium]